MRMLVVFGLCLWGLRPASAQGIHVVFHNGFTTRNAMTSRPPGKVVDVSAAVWNQVVNTGGNGLDFEDLPLRDAGGADTGARLTVRAGYSGYNDNGWGAGTQDHVMMEGWYGFRAGESLVVTDLPPAYAEGFSVLVYGDSNTRSRTMHYTIADRTRTIEDRGTFAGKFSEGVNFVGFTGLTGTSFTLTGNPGATDSRSAVNGLVILPGRLPAPPEIVAFRADDHYVSPGTTVTLSWEVHDADTIRLAPAAGVVARPTSSVEVLPQETTEFTLTAVNADGETHASLRVGVGPPRPNTLFFLVDDMGWQDTSVPFLYDSQGRPVVTPLNRRYRTPNMEALADRGLKFTSAYAMPVCTPTRNCWITGLNSARHHVTNWTNPTGTETGNHTTPSHASPRDWLRGGLLPERITLPSLLQAAGYRTIHAGKAHFGATAYARDPLHVGFDVNIAGSEIGHPGSYYADKNFGTGSHHVPGLESYHGSGLFLTEVLTREMSRAIEQAVADGAPFFAYMAHYAVHAPFQTDPRFRDHYPGLSGRQLAYATLIEGMDQSLGDLLAKLDELGVAESTLVVFMSDNGGDAPISPDSNQPIVMDNAPLRHKKGSKYEGGVRVPMIVAWARPAADNPFQQAHSIPVGAHVDDLVAVFDLFPTFAAVAGVPFHHLVDGFDLSPYLRGEPGPHRPQELLIHYPHDHRSDYFTILRQGEWKLIHNYATDRYELYNLAEDISESRNRAPLEPERTFRLARRMAQRLADAGAQWPTYAANGAGDPLVMPRLPTVDVDHDGLPDSVEDANANGLADPGETDPDQADTDGDGTADGAERKTGTDPLDARSVFRIEPLAPDGSGRLRLRWPSAPGAVYRVETTPALAVPWSPFAETVPAAGDAPATVFDLGSIPSTGHRFYRVAVE